MKIVKNMLLVTVVVGVLAGNALRDRMAPLVSRYWPGSNAPLAALKQQEADLRQTRGELKASLVKLKEIRLSAKDREDLATARMTEIRDKYLKAGERPIEFLDRTLSKKDAREQLVVFNRGKRSATKERSWTEQEIRREETLLSSVEEQILETQAAVKIAPTVENAELAQELVAKNRGLIAKVRHTADVVQEGPIDLEQLQKKVQQKAAGDEEEKWLAAFLWEGEKRTLPAKSQDLSEARSDFDLLRKALTK